MASKNPTRNYAIEYLGAGGLSKKDIAAITAIAIAAAAEPTGDPLGDVSDTGDVAASFLPWLYAQRDGGCAGDGVTGDTAAFQALMVTATAGGTKSGWILMEDGTYLIDGGLLDTGDFNAQLLLPTSATGGVLTLTMRGPARPPQGCGQGPAGVAIIKSNLTGASGTAAVFSAGNTNPAQFSFVFRDILFAAPANPTFTFLNLLKSRDGDFEGLLIDAGPAGFATQPTHSNSYGIKLPETSTSGRVAAQVTVQGFYWGVRHAELTWGDYVVWNCRRAVEVASSYHTGGFIRLSTLACAYGFYVTGANTFDWMYDSEHWSATGFGIDPTSYPTWGANQYDFYDPSNLASGHGQWWGVEAGVGVDHVFLVNGAANVFYEEMGALYGGVAPASADYLVKTATGLLSAERVVTDSEVVWDWGTAGQAKASVGVTHSGSSHAATQAAAEAAAAAAATAYTDAAIAAAVPAGLHAHVVGETHLSDGSTATHTLDQQFEPGSVEAFNTTTLAYLVVTESQPDQATVSAPGASGDKITFSYAATVA